MIRKEPYEFVSRMTNYITRHKGCGGVYLCTKFDVSSFTRYRIREVVPKFKNWTQDQHNVHLFWGFLSFMRWKI